MKSIKYFTLCISSLLLLIISLKSHAQSGYLNKRGIISYNAMVAPNLNSLIYTQVPFIGDKFIWKHQFNTDYIYSNKSVVGASVGYYYSKPSYNAELKDLNPQRIIINEYSFSLYLKFYGLFKTSAYAPIGDYFKIGLSQSLMNINDRSGFLESNQASSGYVPSGNPVQGTASGIGLLASYGSSRVINDKFVLDFGIEMNFIPNIMTSTKGITFVSTAKADRVNTYATTSGLFLFRVSFGKLVL
ncbi:MAG: hypothetical protein SGJ04_04265 [Bacteroidota bacterium]|nr:hypothetical protein [Bacteroidota bacterium]